MRVFVISQRGQALMPCSNQKARILLREHKAQIIRYNPFTIQLQQATGETTQEVHVGIDTGTKYIGIAITNEDKVLIKGEIELRDGIHEVMVTRAVLRRGRRGRKTRYRQPRFLNRKRRDGWLPPTAKSKLDATFHWIDTFMSLLPNAKLHIEIGKFDIARMKNPNINGTEYQTGQCAGYYDARAFVFERDGYQCQVCKKRNKPLQAHHIVYRSCGGSDRADNLISVCTDCHTSDNHKSGGILYDWMQKGKKLKQYREPTFMNIIAKRTRDRYPNAVYSYGSDTVLARHALGLPKTHYNDAIAISGITHVKNNSNGHFYYKQFRKKKRSLHEQCARAGRKEPNRSQKRNKKNVKYRNGFWLNDELMYKGTHCWVYGFACGESGKVCVVRDINGELQREKPGGTTIRMQNLIRVCHNDGWQHVPVCTAN